MGRGWRRKERERGWEEDGRYKDGGIKKGIREREGKRKGGGDARMSGEDRNYVEVRKNSREKQTNNGDGSCGRKKRKKE